MQRHLALFLLLHPCISYVAPPNNEVCDWDIYQCFIPYDIHYTYQFICIDNLDCPPYFKCCSHRCFRHNICQPSNDMEVEPQLVSTDVTVHPGECDIILSCGIQLPRSFTERFLCLQDDDCPEHFKCCYIHCYDHKVCQPAKNEYLLENTVIISTTSAILSTTITGDTVSTINTETSAYTDEESTWSTVSVDAITETPNDTQITDAQFTTKKKPSTQDISDDEDITEGSGDENAQGSTKVNTEDSISTTETLIIITTKNYTVDTTNKKPPIEDISDDEDITTEGSGDEDTYNQTIVETSTITKPEDKTEPIPTNNQDVTMEDIKDNPNANTVPMEPLVTISTTLATNLDDILESTGGINPQFTTKVETTSLNQYTTIKNPTIKDISDDEDITDEGSGNEDTYSPTVAETFTTTKATDPTPTNNSKEMTMEDIKDGDKASTGPLVTIVSTTLATNLDDIPESSSGINPQFSTKLETTPITTQELIELPTEQTTKLEHTTKAIYDESDFTFEGSSSGDDYEDNFMSEKNTNEPDFTQSTTNEKILSVDNGTAFENASDIDNHTTPTEHINLTIEELAGDKSKRPTEQSTNSLSINKELDDNEAVTEDSGNEESV